MVGTTGFTEADLDEIRARVHQELLPIAANFAIGAVLMMRFAELAAPWFETAEIIELHHDGKIDAPSGTAMPTAERMAAASQRLGRRPHQEPRVEGARGGAGPAASRSTRCASTASSPTRRCCSARPARASPSATTPSTAPASCLASCSR